jgi:hypothetical protein
MANDVLELTVRDTLSHRLAVDVVVADGALSIPITAACFGLGMLTLYLSGTHK